VNSSHTLKGGTSLLLHLLLRRHSPLASGRVLREFSVIPSSKELAGAEVPSQLSIASDVVASTQDLIRGVPSLLFEHVYLHAYTSLLPTANELRNRGYEESVLCSTFSQQNHTLVLYRMRQYIMLCAPQYNSARRPGQDSKKEEKRESHMTRSLFDYLKQPRGTIHPQPEGSGLLYTCTPRVKCQESGTGSQ
jgi:hypothetical protein